MTDKSKNILETIRYATISSVDNKNRPWAAPVWYVFDEDYNIYWWSPIDSQHSKNIEYNSNIYITVFDSTAPEGDGFGLYMRAEAGVVADDEPSVIKTVAILKEKTNGINYREYTDRDHFKTEEFTELLAEILV